jgi:CCR4-NOT transcription complex subunit 1
VLIHDFPEFLCDFHHSFCDVLPPTCIQLRNLILSAFPRNVKLPDPALNIKMEQIPASKESPRVFNIEHAIQEAGLGERLDSVLKSNADPAPFYAALPSLLLHKDAQGKSSTYNTKLINSLVLFVGITAIADPHNKIPMEMFMSLANALDAEGRYHLFNAFANQLRYPSSHTHYFSWALLYIFSESQNEAVPEQITRVLLERYIAQKPTPWGLAITYQELTKNPSYNFWSRDFVKASPDIGRLFMNLSRRGSSR